MHGPPLFAVDFKFAIARLELERDKKRVQRLWTNIIVLASIALLLWFSVANMSYEHSIVILMNLATFGFLMDRMNRLHIKYIEDQLNLLICIERKGCEAVEVQQA